MASRQPPDGAPPTQQHRTSAPRASLASPRRAERGKDGCVIRLNDGQVVKRFFRGIPIPDHTVQDVLSKLDPEERRFVRYHPWTPPKAGRRRRKHMWAACGGRPLSRTFVRMSRLEPLSPRQLSRKQYRYLRESLRILHSNDQMPLVHLDLPGNVMMGADGLPRIIDWETARPADPLGIQIDNHAFLHEFGVANDGNAVADTTREHSAPAEGSFAGSRGMALL